MEFDDPLQQWWEDNEVHVDLMEFNGILWALWKINPYTFWLFKPLKPWSICRWWAWFTEKSYCGPLDMGMGQALWYLNFSSPKMNRTIFTLTTLPILVVFMMMHGLYEFLEASKETSLFPPPAAEHLSLQGHHLAGLRNDGWVNSPTKIRAFIPEQV